VTDDAPTVVQYRLERGVATITLDSPANRNALSRTLLAQLGARVGDALADDAARVVVLSHTGTVFCAGADLKDPPGPDAAWSLPGILDLLWTAPKPVVARVGGHARAGGVGLLAACDIAVATPAATFSFSEVRIGVAPAIISLVTLPRLGHTRALELYLTGETFDGERAAAIGLVNAVADDVDAAVAAYVEQLRLGAPRALAETKRLVRAPLDFSAMERLSLELFGSADAAEGIAAFREKRPPRWAQ
jgi:methylglutaconyl-CoA hydratase